jgi:hypothetical protein
MSNPRFINHLAEPSALLSMGFNRVSSRSLDLRGRFAGAGPKVELQVRVLYSEDV